MEPPGIHARDGSHREGKLFVGGDDGGDAREFHPPVGADDVLRFGNRQKVGRDHLYRPGSPAGTPAGRSTVRNRPSRLGDPQGWRYRVQQFYRTVLAVDAPNCRQWGRS